MKIGIYGGTFDPPHIGHINACKAFLDQIELDVLYVIPVYMPPHKNIFSGTDVTSRLEMTRLAFQELSNKIVVSDIEIKREGRSYTADTLKYFKGEFNNPEIYFLCGTDMILTMDFWYKPEYIFENATIVYARRESDENITAEISAKCKLYEEKYNASILSIDLSATEVSSSDIRKRISNDENEVYLTPSIYDYILKNGLYKEK